MVKKLKFLQKKKKKKLHLNDSLRALTQETIAFGDLWDNPETISS
jgi:hypothetical protein